MNVRTTYKSYRLDNGIFKKGMANMKKRTVLTMILAVTIISGILSGCGEKKASAKEPSVKAEQLSIADNNKKKEIATNSVTINVLVDKGWDADSTPAILHIAAKDTEDVEFYHAITPDEDGGKGSTTVTLAQGTYDVEFISPLNHDGSAYEIYDMGASQEITVELGKDMTVDCEMKQIPAEQVTDEMIQDIVTKTQAAVEKGDETLKGDAGKATLDKLASNVQNSPNASEETKDMANTVKENTDTETKPEETVKTEAPVEQTKNNQTDNQVQNNPAQDNNVQNNTAVNNNQNTQNNTAVNNNQNTTQDKTTNNNTTKPSTPVVTEPEKPAHVHTWADHVVTTQEWVENLVTIPDYETKEVPYWHCTSEAYELDGSLSAGSTFCGMDFRLETEEDEKILEEHITAHLLAGEWDNGYNFSKTETIQIGSHTEDQGHYETKTTVDYRYCTECGARQ